MRTDDFLADLELQLRDARPPRDLRPVLTAAVLAAAAIAAVALLAFAPRQRDEPFPATNPVDNGRVSVEVRNGTLIRGLPVNTVNRLEHNGYRVLPVVPADDRYLDTTTVTATSKAAMPAAERIAKLINRPARLDDDRFAAPLAHGAQVVITIGRDLAPSVLVSNYTGVPGSERSIAARLRRLGFEVEVSGLGLSGAEPRTQIQKSGYDRHRAMLVANALGLDRSTVHGRGAGSAHVDVVVYAGRDLTHLRP